MSLWQGALHDDTAIHPRSYDRRSHIYDEDGNPLVALEAPRVRDLVGDVSNLAIADVGCGTGRHALELAAAGARVTALDFSAGMLAKARAKPGAESITFIEHDIGRPLPLPSASFDRVLCCLVLDHIAELRALFAELERVCRRDGLVVASVMHPAMMLKGVQARFQDPETGQEIYPQSVANQISDYVMAALQAGLRLTDMSEHAVDEELAGRLPRARKYLGWPMLLLLTLTPF
jgi:malonyl-CoA O-methyltransferase